MATLWVAMHATNIVSLQSVVSEPTDVLQMEVSLANSDAVTAVEVKIPLDEGMSYVDESVVLNSARSNGHIISAAEVNKELRIYIYSLSLGKLKGSEGLLFSFKLKIKKDPVIHTLMPEVVLSNKAGKSLQAKVEAGTITILSPKLEFVTKEVNFGHVPIRADYSRMLTLKNVGTSKLNIKSIAIPDNRFVVSDTEFSLEVGATKSITLKYSPIKHGAISHKLTVVSDAINSEESIDVVADPYSINELHVGKVEGVADSIVSLPLSVKNMEPIVGVQFRFKMPQKLQFDDFELSPRTNNYIVLNSQEKDTLSMMLYSLSKSPMKGNDGEIGKLKLKLVGNSGYNYLNPVDVVLSNAEEENMVSATSQGWVRIKSPKLSCETSFTMPRASVTSYSSGTYYLKNAGQSPLVIDQVSFMAEGFKVVSKLPITILAGETDSLVIEHRASIEDDYSAIMNIYTNDPDNDVKKVLVNCYMYEPNSLKLTGEPAFIKLDVDSVQGYNLNVQMNNYSDIVAMQFDVHWGAKMSTNIDYLLTTDRLNGHNCSVTKIDNTTYRVLLFEMNNKVIKRKSGTVITLGYVGTDFKGTIVVDNIILSDAKGKNRMSEPTTSLDVKVNKLTVSSNDTTMGTVTGGGYFNRGTKVTISAEAKYGYVFSKWSDGSTDTTRVVTLNANTNLTAIFLTNMHTVTLSGKNGKVIGAGEYQHGKEVEIEAIPNEGYHFVKWSDGDTVAKRKFTILDNVNLTAEFAINVYTVTLSATNGATQGAGKYNHGTTVTINAVAAVGYHFVKWSDGATKAKRSFVLVSDTTLTAEFAINQYTVSVTTKNGKIEGVGKYDYGSIVDLVAVPDEGYHFVQWSDGETEPERSIAVTSNVSLSAEFAINVYKVEVSAENGVVTGAGNYEHGDTINISCTPNEGYHFVKWSDGDARMKREIIVKSDLNLVAEIAINVYTVSLYSANGVVSGAGKYNHGDTVKISVTPNEGYHFVKWSDGDTIISREFVITSDVNLTADVVINVYTLTAEVENGTVTGAGQYNHGTNAYIKAYPDYGYHFIGWSDGVEEEARYVKVVSDTTVTALMEINEYEVKLTTENGVVLGSGRYKHGTTITISAIPNEGYHFVKWSDNSKVSEREIVVKSDLDLSAEIAINVYTVNLSAENGVVTGAGEYNHGDIAEISVTPNEGYHFVRWSDGVIEPSRSFKVVKNVELSAQCAINRYFVNLSAENGAVKGTGEYNYGSKVTLIAIPNEGYHFVEWSDGSTEITRDITVNDDITLTAIFAINVYKLELDAINGVVNGAGDYQHGEVVEISVVANEHYHFVKWSDGNVQPTRSIKMISDTSLVAECSIDMFEVTADVENGKILGVGRYEYGSVVEFTAEPNRGYHFVRWSDGETSKTRSLTITSDMVLSAEFAIDVFEVVLSAENGTVTGAGEYQFGEVVVLNATPNEGYHFVRWSDGSTEPNRKIVVVEDIALTAEFAINIYDVVVNVQNAAVSGVGKYEHGTTANIVIEPNKGHHFVSWKDGEYDAERQIVVVSDTTLHAVIEADIHTVSLMAENGNVIGAGQYSYGSMVTLSAVPNVGYHFVRWSDGDENAMRIITVTEDVDLTAEFAINVYTVSLFAENGEVVGSGNYQHGAEVEIVAIPNVGHHFVRWSDGNTETSRVVTVTSDLNLTAIIAINVHKVELSAQNGDVVGAGEYNYGTKLTVMALANEGYHFVGWSDGVVEPTRTITVYSDTSLVATFEINVYNVSLTYDSNKGSVVGAGDYEHGEIVTIKAIPNEGYHFVKWSDGNESLERTFAIDQDINLTAEFAIEIREIVVVAENGTVTGAGRYEYGTTATLEAIPNEGYHFVGWSDGVEESTRTIDVTEDVNLIAVFEINVYNVVLTTENGEVVGSGSYEHGTEVELKAIPQEGYHFVRWSDGVENAIRKEVVTTDIVLAAEFAINVYSLVLEAENGVVVGSGEYEHGTEVEISVIPNEGYYFEGWSDGDLNSTRTIVMNSDLNLTANISIYVYDVVLNVVNGVVTGAGRYEYGDTAIISVIPNEGCHFVGWSDGETAMEREIIVVENWNLTAQNDVNIYSVELSAENGEISGAIAGDYSYGTELTIAAIPNEGYHFVGWSDGVMDAERTIKITSNVALTAQFAINVYSVVLFGENGVIEGSGDFEHGTEIEISAIANEGYHFVAWSDGDLNAIRKVVVTSDTTLFADIQINVYSVVLTTEHATVVGSGKYEHGTQVTIYVTPEEGYSFVGWSDGESQSTRTLVVTSDIELHANILINQYDLILTAENGTITNAGKYDHGSEVEISAIPNEGYHFVRWSDGDTLPTKVLTMTTNVTLSAYFAINVYDVVLNVDNGIVFGEGSYNHGSSITIAAYANEGYHFVGWSDGDEKLVRTITVVSDTILTAQFEIDQHTITLSAENGDVYGGGIYDYGSVVELRAEADKNYHFVGWSDGNENMVRTVVVKSDLNLTAMFAINRHKVVLTAENGVVAGSGEYDYSSVLEIKAEANEGYHFVGWSDGDENPIRTIVVTSDVELSAEFEINVYSVVLQAVNGSVSGMGEYTHGTTVNILAVPDAGYEFVKWSDGNESAERVFEITSDVNLIAEFAKEIREVVVEAENGFVVGAGRYEYGSEAILNAIPNEGYHFVGWSDGETSALRTITMLSDTVLIAQFAINVYTVNLLAENGVVVGSGEYEHGAEVKISATPNEGYYFVGWSDGVTDAVRIITVLSDTILKAEFVSNLYSVALSCENGIVLGSGLYEHGTEIDLIATPDEGYEFVRWSDGYSSPQRTIVVVSDIELSAEFKLKTLNVSLYAENGEVSGSDAGDYTYGTELTIVAIPNEGYHFVGWSDGVMDVERTIKVTSDIALIAQFEINVYSVVLKGDNGKVYGAGEYEHGTEVTLTAEPNEGYHFVRWSDGDNNAIRTMIVTSDVELEAEFSKEIREVVVYAENGVVNGAGRHAYGAIVVLSAIPNEGYHFVGWSDGVTDAVRTLTVLADTTLTAEFALNSYRVNLIAENGVVYGGGVYDYGSVAELRAEPNEGYQFIRWSDGVTDATRVIEVTSDTLLVAEFSNDVRMVVLYGDNGVVYGAGRYAYGTTALLSAKADEGYHFVCWSDGVTDATREVEVTSDITLVAEFAINVYNVELVAANGGEVVGAEEYEHGSEIEISAKANEGYQFVRWSDGVVDATRTIIVTSDITLKAEFVIEVMKVDVIAENAVVIGAGEYAYGSMATIVVIPNEGYQFLGWADGVTDATRVIEVTSDTLLTAEVSSIVYSVELSCENGTVVGAGEYVYGSVVTIEATPDEGYHFVRWSDGVVDAIRTIELRSDIILVAEFALNVYTVELVATNGGEVVGAGVYEYGSEVEISAEAHKGYQFVGWSDGVVDATRTFIVASDITLKAEFAIEIMKVDVIAENAVVIGAGEYTYGSKAMIAVVPNVGYQFVGWSDGVTDATRVIEVTSDTLLTAEVSPIVYSVELNSENGTVVGAGEYEYGSAVTIEAIPNEGYHFVRWSDGVVDAIRTIELRSDITLVAEFAINVYTVELIAANGGEVVGAGEYEYGLEVEISAEANEGYQFVGWSDGVVDATRTIVVTSDITLKAEFAIEIMTVDVIAENAIVIGVGEYAYGSMATIVVIPNEGYQFVCWSDGVTEATRVIEVTSDMLLTAEVSQIVYSVELSCENGTVVGAGEYVYGSVVTIEAIPEEGYHFVGWSDGDDDSVRTIVVTSDIELYAEFEANVYRVTLIAENGSFVGEGSYDYGTEVTLVAIPDDGYKFIKWSDGNSSISRTIVVTEDVTLHAEFEKIITKVNVYTKDQILHIEGAVDGYYLYDAFGNIIYTGPDNQIFLPSGIYFIKVGGLEIIKIAM